MQKTSLNNWKDQYVTKILLKELKKERDQLAEQLATGQFLRMDDSLNRINYCTGSIKILDDILEGTFLDNLPIEED